MEKTFRDHIKGVVREAMEKGLNYCFIEQKLLQLYDEEQTEN